MKAIVTGANGFVGSAVCRELSDRGYEVIAVVRSEKSVVTSIKGLRGLQILYCDMDSYSDLKEQISERDIDMFYHFAWEGSAGSLRGDNNVQMNNIKCTCDAVSACADLGCKRFIFAASIMEYEINAFMQTDIAPGINSIYPVAKLTADYMAKTLAGKMGIEYIRGVISNRYGPGEISPRLVNTSLRKMLKNEHCAFSAGEQMYDFIYITDAAKAFVAVGESGRPYKTYYIGSLEPKPLRFFLLEMRDRVDPLIEIGLGELPFDGVSLSYEEFDVLAVKKDTGFVPLVSFSEDIGNTIDWIRENSL